MRVWLSNPKNVGAHRWITKDIPHQSSSQISFLLRFFSLFSSKAESYPPPLPRLGKKVYDNIQPELFCLSYAVFLKEVASS